MAVVWYEPFGLLNTRPAFGRLFDQLFEDALGWNRDAAPAARSAGVAVNLYETPEAYFVELPLPGIRPEDVEVTAQQNILTISAKRNWQMPEQAQLLWQGFGSGEWKQSFTLPGEVNPDKVDASMEYGVLRLQLPKAEHMRPRTIRVSSLSSPEAQPAIEGKAVESGTAKPAGK
jgi:HSP20 family protein